MKKNPTLADAEKYLTHEYIDGEFDCGSLAVLVQRELFGREVDVPHAAERARGARGQANDLAKYQKAMCELVAQPATGDAVIMWTTTEHGEPPLNRRWHVGTAFLSESNEVWVLHCANEKRGVALQRLSHIESNGVHVDAFYTWVEPKKLQLSVFPRPLSGEVEIHYVPYGTTLAELLRARGLVDPSWTVRLNGIAIPFAMWPLTRVRHGVLIEAHAQARKSVLNIVAMLALAYFTFGAGSLFIGAGAAIGGGFIAAAAVYIGGAMLINKLLGPKPASATSMDNTQAPPTYSLTAPQNRARLWEPLSMVLGETKAVPDNANQAFTWFDGQDQYLSAQFHAGINCFDVSDIKIGNTPISTYDGVEIRRYGFPENNSENPPIVGSSVDSVEGGLIDWPKGNPEPTPLVRVTSPGTVRIELDLEGTIQRMNDKGKWESKTMTVGMRYRAVGDEFWQPLGSGTYTITNMGPKPVRLTLPFDVPEGRYEVELKKGEKNSSGEGSEERLQNDIALVRLKSYQPDTADYGGQPRIEVRIKASGQLNGGLNEVNWIARQRPMDYWNGSAWVTVTEPGANGISNPGALILMLLRGIYRPSDGKRIAGVGFSDSRIDLDSLKGFMVRCAAKGYRFDFFLQEAMNAQTLIETIASAGLATITRQNNGRIGVVWFAEDQPIEGVINMASMHSGTSDGPASSVVSNFTVQYDLIRTADEFQLEFFDRDNDWTWQPMRVIAPGVDVPQRTSSQNVRGVTTMQQAATLARFSMAQNLYGRKTISFELAMDYMDYKRGAVVALSHDLTQWGYSGRLFAVSFAASSFTLQLDDPVPPGGTSIGLRLPGERQMRTFPVASVGADGLSVVVGQAWPGGANAPGTTSAVHDTLWIYDFKATPGYRVRIMSIEPGSNSETAHVTCVPESPEFWNYIATGEFIPPPNNSSLIVDLPVVSNLNVVRGRILQSGSWVHQLTASFDARGAYDHAQVWAAPVGNALELIDANVFGTQASWTVPADQTWNIEVRPFDALGRMGTRAAFTYTDPSELVGAVAGLSATIEENGVVVRWGALLGVDAIGWSLTQVKISGVGGTFETASLVFSGRTDSCNIGWLAAQQHVIWARHGNDAGDFSAPVTTTLTVLPPAQPVITDDTFFAQVQLDWQNCRTSQPIRGYEIRIGNIFAQAEFKTLINAQTFVFIPPTAGVYRYWVASIDVAGNMSAPGYVDVETTAQIDAALDELQNGLDEQLQQIIGLGHALEAEANARGTDITEVKQLIVDGDEQVASLITSITARAGNGGNLVENSEFVQDITGWTFYKDSSTVWVSVKAEAQYTVGAGSIKLYEDGRDASPVKGGLLFHTKPIPVIAGRRYQFAAYVAAHRAKADVLIQWYTAADALISASVGTMVADAAPLGGPSLANWVRLWLFAEAPAGAVYARPVLRKLTTNAGSTNSAALFARPHFAAANTGQTEPDEYAPAGLTTGITAAVQTVATAVANLSGFVEASYSLVLTANGKISGFKATINGTESSLVFLFDRVSFAINNADNQPKQLMTLGMVAGVPSVGIAGNLYLDGFLVARHIQADQIDAIHLRANSITADKIKAGSVTADKMAIGVAANMLANSQLLSARGWTNDLGSVPADSGTAFGGVDYLGNDWAPLGGHTLSIYQPNDYYYQNQNIVSQIYSDMIPVVGGQRYEGSMYLAAHRCLAYVLIAWYDGGGNYLGEAAGPVNNDQYYGGKTMSNYFRSTVFAYAPPTAASARLFFRKGVTKIAGSNSYAWMTQPYFGAAGASQTVPAAYSPAGVGTYIGPEGIRTNFLSSITANMGYLTAGRIDVSSEESGNTWGYVRSFGKWYRDGNNGWCLARDPAGNTFVSIEAGECKLWMSNFDGAGWVSPGISMTNGGLTINQLNVIDTLNVRDQAITLPLGAYTAGTQGVANGNEVVVQSLGINSTGAPIQVLAMTYFGGNTQNGTVSVTGVLHLHRDGVRLLSNAISIQGPLIFFFVDTPGAGYHNYQLVGSASGGSGNHGARTITLLECKK